MIIAVSDLHLGNPHDGRDTEFLHFLRYVYRNFPPKTKLVLCGDTWDFWRYNMYGALRSTEEIIGQLCRMNHHIELYAVLGNHDCILDKFPGAEYLFRQIGPEITLFDNQHYTFIHGHQFEVLANPYIKDLAVYNKLSERLCMAAPYMGTLADKLWKRLKPEEHQGWTDSMLQDPNGRLRCSFAAGDKIDELAKAPSRHLVTTAQPGEWLVYGHTHKPYIDPDSKTLNLGSWGRSFKNNGLCYAELGETQKLRGFGGA